MLQLKDFRSQAKGLPDLLTYAALIEPGIILQKDGSFLAAWEIRGEDTASATPDTLCTVGHARRALLTPLHRNPERGRHYAQLVLGHVKKILREK